MSRFFVRKWLDKVGLLGAARSVKRKLVGARPNEFKPADPRLLVSTLQCLRWLHARELLEGSDYLEFGIFRGFNVWYTQAVARALGLQDMRFFGFDSFFGLPPVTGIDAGGAFKEGDFSAYKEEVEGWLTRYGVDWNKTFLIKGFFENSLTPALVQQHKLRRTAFCVVDCDLYSSTVTVLDFVEPFLGDQTVLFFDDWDDFGKDNEAKGEAKAFAEFRAKHKDALEAEPFEDLVAQGGKGRAFIIRRKAAVAPAGSQPALVASA